MAAVIIALATAVVAVVRGTDPAATVGAPVPVAGLSPQTSASTPASSGTATSGPGSSSGSTSTSSIASLPDDSIAPATTAPNTAPPSDTTESSGSGSTTSSASPAGTLLVAVTSLPKTADPMLAVDTGQTLYFAQVLDGLTAYSANGQTLEPGLATSWKASADGKTWTFALKSGVSFSNGAKLTAGMVCENFDHWNSLDADQQDDAFVWSEFMGGFGSASADVYRGCSTDGESVTITLKVAYSYFPELVGLPYFGIGLPSAIGAGSPIGTGPYQVDDSGPSSTATLVAVANTTVTKRIVFSAAASSGDPNTIAGPLSVGSVTSSKTVSTSMTESTMMVLNAGTGHPLSDGSLRQAVNLAIDRGAVAKAMGAGSQGTNTIVPAVALAEASAPWTGQQNLVKAKQLVTAAKTKPSITMLVKGWGSNAAAFRAAATVIQTELAQVGVTLSLKIETEAANYYKAFSSGFAQDLILVTYPPYTNDPLEFVDGVIGGLDTASGISTAAAWRKSIASQIDDAYGILDLDQRRTATIKIVNSYLSQNTVIPLTQAPDRWIVGSAVQNFSPSPLAFFRLDQIAVVN